MAIAQSKPAYTSVTVLASFLILAVSLGKALGYDLSGLLDIQQELIVAGGALVAIYGRLRATKFVSIL